MREPKDRIGEKFNKLTIVSRVFLPDGKRTQNIVCNCDCGTEGFITNMARVISGMTKSCGCYRQDVIRQIPEGHKFGDLTISRLLEAKFDRKSTYLCKCLCGNEVIATQRNLERGHIISCGCSRKRPKVDLVGAIIRNFTVIKYLGRTKSQGLWLCKCTCGTEVELTKGQLDRDWLNSCHNCSYPNPSEDLTNHRFGKLVVKYLCKDKSNYGGIQWCCKCDCGNEVIVLGIQLRKGITNSCGCLRYRVKEECPNFNPEITDEERSTLRNFPDYNKWSKQVKEADNYTCYVCKKRGGYLHSHHLDSYREHPERRVDPSNGVTLCKECHKKFHSTYGRKVTYEWQFVEYYYKNQNQKFLKLDIAA